MKKKGKKNKDTVVHGIKSHWDVKDNQQGFAPHLCPDKGDQQGNQGCFNPGLKLDWNSLDNHFFQGHLQL